MAEPQRPLMPKATAVWLVDNTSLSFDQIADFCKLHPLEVKGIADGDVAAGIKGLDPVTGGQLTREEIAKGGKFEDIAKRESDDSVSGSKGGDLGRSVKGAYVKEFDDAVFSSPIGTLSQPVKASTARRSSISPGSA